MKAFTMENWDFARKNDKNLAAHLLQSANAHLK
jgi:hypothetical protein